MINDASYVRKALKAAQDELIREIELWDTNTVDAGTLDEWQQKAAGLVSMLSRVMQETEMHRRQIIVITSEMQLFERSARATRILDLGASRSIAAQADLMTQDLAAANDLLVEMEAEEQRLKAAVELADLKIRSATISSSKEEQQDPM